MGFVSEQGSIWKDQASRCERRDFVDCVPWALLEEQVPQDSRWLARAVGSECLWGNTIPSTRWYRVCGADDLELHGINHNDLAWLGENELWAITGP